MTENQSSLQELQGRSQHLTCDSVDCVLVDENTLEELNWALVEAIDGLHECELWQEFITVAERYLKETTETQRLEEWERPINSAMLFLDAWSDKSPDILGIATAKLSEAHRVLHMVLAASKLGGQ
jgi:hypothetical protein